MVKSTIETSSKSSFTPLEALFLHNVAVKATEEIGAKTGKEAVVCFKTDADAKHGQLGKALGSIRLFDPADIDQKHPLAYREIEVGYHIHEETLVRRLVQNCPQI
jgi:hypothetical protein